MKTKMILIVLMLQLSMVVNATVSIICEDKTANSNYVTDLVEDIDGNFIYSGRYYYGDTKRWAGYITKVSPEGVRLCEYINTDTNVGSRFESINITSKGTFIVTGSEASDEHSGITVMEFDNNLELLWRKYHKIVNYKSQIFHPRVIEIGDGNYVGVFSELGNGFEFADLHNYVFKFSSDGELLKLVEDTISHKFFVPSDILSIDSGKSFVIVAPKRFLILDSELKVIEEISQSHNPIDLENWFETSVSCKILSDGRALCSSGHVTETGNRSKYGLMLIQLEDNYRRGDKFKVINKGSIVNEPSSSDYRGYASEHKSIDFVSENNIIIGGTLNVYWGIPSMRPYMTKPSLLCVASFDQNLNMNWEQYYEDEYSYYMMSMCATKDGGAVIAAIKTREDSTPEYQVGNVVIIKFDNPTIGVEDLSESSKFNVYPNPATDNVILRFDGEGTTNSAAFYDTTGRLCKTIGVLSSGENICISDLSKGVYVVKLMSGNIVLGSQKLIVK